MKVTHQAPYALRLAAGSALRWIGGFDPFGQYAPRFSRP